MKELLNKIKSGKAVVGVMGLGYVGLTLAMASAKKFKVVGKDIADWEVKMLLDGKSYIKDVSDETVKKVINKSFFPSTDIGILKEADFIIVCMPTPLHENKEPDLRHVVGAVEEIAGILRKGQFVVLESTTYPGTTDDVVKPILEKTGMKAGRDFGLAFSPERIDPGNKKYHVENTPKVVGGINDECTEIAAVLYERITKVVRVSSARAAEATKVLENIFRGVNIALVNELALLFEKMGIDTWEVIKAASTKPYGFMPHYPGSGVGGHCIPLDPFYLSYEAKKFGFIPKFIELSGEINDFMPFHTVNLAREALAEAGTKLRNSLVAVMGIGYKKDFPDTRESPSAKIIEELAADGASVVVHDPFAKEIRTKKGVFKSTGSAEEALRNADCAIFAMDHTPFKSLDLKRIKGIMRRAVIVDGRNLFDENKVAALGFIYRGIGKPRKTA